MMVSHQAFCSSSIPAASWKTFPLGVGRLQENPDRGCLAETSAISMDIKAFAQDRKRNKTLATFWEWGHRDRSEHCLQEVLGSTPRYSNPH
ncbi:hypothetical protein O181_128315 [Austropuccinia psidii MF-1]|uniref:Uncharacterized protein n=1 Tax=Austropuccinia psidii MF-1 TaxID=1389203 RepID=A0A9Q3KUX1_9BASI|nr:hypothetical protein [Austropuccinia psidii MF-1]